jgi:hypothetical protein
MIEPVKWLKTSLLKIALQILPEKERKKLRHEILVLGPDIVYENCIGFAI